MRFLDAFQVSGARSSGPTPRGQTMAEPKVYKKLMKAASRIGSRLLPFRGFGTSDGGETSPYNFERIINAVDTDSYAKTAFSRYQELMWKEGYEIVGENQEAVDYVRTRIEYMSLSMGRPIDDFFQTVTDSLCKFHNAFIAKVRNPGLVDVFPGEINTNNPKGPVVGYEIIPTEDVRIIRDEFNRPIKYIQGSTSSFSGDKSAPSWDADEVIHLYRDKRPGKAFGTPFMTATMDDIIVLRQMENDVQNMVHQELNPIIDVTIGSNEFPGDDSEVDRAAETIASMMHDGTLVHTERVNLDIKGSQGKALDATGYLNITQSRVAIGLGLYPHHLGMRGADDPTVTERLDTALYDRIKTYQRYFASMVVQQLLNELLVEGGFNPYVPKANDGISDQCIFRFREIDQDTMVKKENHVIQKVVSNLMTLSEGRAELGLEPEFDEDDTHAALNARISMEVIDRNNDGKKVGDGTTDLDKQKPSTGGRPNQKNYRKGPGNKSSPKNQHGRRLSPNIKQDDIIDDWIETALMLSEMEEMNE